MPKESDLKIPKQTFKNLLGVTLWTLRRMFLAAPFHTVILVISNIGNTLLPILNSYIFALLIDNILKTYNSGVQSISDIIYHTGILPILLFYAGVSILSTILQNLNQYTGDQVYNYHIEIQNSLLTQKIASLDIAQFEDKAIANKIKKARDSVWKMKNVVKTSVRGINAIVSLIAAFIITVTLSPLLALIAVALAIPGIYVYVKFNRKYWELNDVNAEKWRREGWISWSTMSEEYIYEHKVIGSERFLTKIYMGIQRHLLGQQLSIGKQQLKEGTAIVVFDAIGLVAIPIYLIYLAFMKIISIGKFSFYIGQASSLTGKMSDAAYFLNDMTMQAKSINYIKEIYDLKPAIKQGSRKMKKGEKITIEFKNVSFQYPTGSKLALRNVNLTIKSGEEIAFVGKNGAGKTTLIKLLLRFYDPTKGQILVNGKPLKDLDLASYYAQISTLFQDYNAYSPLDPATNIYIGQPNRKFVMKEIQAAAQKADAHDFIMKLKHKYKQLLSNYFTGGVQLSPGQWQKLAIARMFYRDTPVLILDEPTASIDAMSEYKIFKRIFEFIKDKTLIIISHRFSTVRNAQKIYVLDDGKIVETGSHEELMSINGQYAKAFKLQAEGYQKKRLRE